MIETVNHSKSQDKGKAFTCSVVNKLFSAVAIANPNEEPIKVDDMDLE